MIIHCPKANENNIKKAVAYFVEAVANAIIATNIGVEQGEAKNANKTPIKNGYQNKLVDSLLGIFLTTVGMGISMIPVSCSPNAINTEPKIINKTGEAKLPKTLPETAQNNPKMPITVDKPTEKDNNFRTSSL